ANGCSSLCSVSTGRSRRSTDATGSALGSSPATASCVECASTLLLALQLSASSCLALPCSWSTSGRSCAGLLPGSQLLVPIELIRSTFSSTPSSRFSDAPLIMLGAPSCRSQHPCLSHQS